jgi:hypothetical protein
MRNAIYNFYLAGQEVNNPTDWQEIQILSTSDNDGIQNSVSASEITFPLEAARQIRQWVIDGTGNGVGIFEGIPFDITVSNGAEVSLIGNYILDFDTYTETEDRKVNVSFRLKDGLNQLADRLEAITFGWLESKGSVTAADYVTVDYLLVPKNSATEIVSLNIITAIMAKATIDSIYNLGVSLGIFSGIAVAGIGGPVGAGIFKIAQIIVQVAQVAATLLAFAKMFVTFVNAFLPLPRKAKAMTYRRMLEIVAEYLGYELETNLPLENYVYLPSNTQSDTYGKNGLIQLGKGTQKGIPQSNDYGYALSEFMDLLKTLFNGKFAVIDGTLHFRNTNDSFWITTASYSLPEDLFIEATRYNTQDLKANKLFKFRTDTADEYTVSEFTGTNYEVITSPIRVSERKNVLLKGLEQIDFKVALGNLKYGTTPFESLLLTTAKIADAFSKLFGGNSNLYQQVLSSVSTRLKVSNNNYTVAKILYYVNGAIPNNHRDFLSAKALYNEYYVSDSFTLDFYGQKSLYTDVRIPFNYEGFLKVSANSYIKDFQGRVAKITSLKWSVGEDFAVIDFWVRQPYTFNLQETFIEA